MNQDHPISDNLIYLVDHLTSNKQVINHLLEKRIITADERERLLLPNQTTTDINSALFLLLIRKDWFRIQDDVLSIFRVTDNNRCAEKLLGISTVANIEDSGTTVSLVLEEKWWPEKKQLPESLYKRKYGDTLMVEELFKRLQNNVGKSAAYSQKIVIPGMGGVGKTTLAKWFGDHYENNYDHIVWIECGEFSSLSESFQALARDLDIKNRKELKCVEHAKKCFQKLSKYKCLFVFDNAEKYTGGTSGIKDVLPTNNSNFHCLITSRHTEWGQKTGHGKMESFNLDVFQESESLEFLRKNLMLECEESELEILPNLLGNLPLALQIAVATLNNDGRLSVEDYIKLIQNPEDVICSHVTLDDYENTINKTMKISLDRIKNIENGQLAYDILIILGFLQPVGIEVDFLASITEKQPEKIKSALALLEVQSLINRSFSPTRSDKELLKSERQRLATFNLPPGWPLSFVSPKDLAKDGFFFLQRSDYVQCRFCDLTLHNWVSGDVPHSEHIKFNEECPLFSSLSLRNIPIENEKTENAGPASTNIKYNPKMLVNIHRLIQQVIRFNEKAGEVEILRKILGCKGFLGNKHIPYVHAHEHKDLQEEFKHIKAVVIDQENLVGLLKAENHIEALNTSKVIKEIISESGTTVQRLSSRYNYAHCLYKVENFVESLDQFKNIFVEIPTDFEIKTLRHYGRHNLKRLDEIMSKTEVGLRCMELQHRIGHWDELANEYMEHFRFLNVIDISRLDVVVDLQLLMNVKIVKLGLLKILFHPGRDAVDDLLQSGDFIMDTLEIWSINFVDRDGERLAKIDFHDFHFLSMRKLKITQFNVHTIVNINFSKLPPEVEVIHLNGLEINGADEKDLKYHFEFESVTLENIRNIFNINCILSKCISLQQFEWVAKETPPFLLQVSQIPLTVNSIKASLNCIDSNSTDKFSPKLQNLVFVNNTLSAEEMVDILQRAVNMFTSERLSLSYNGVMVDLGLQTDFKRILEDASSQGRI